MTLSRIHTKAISILLVFSVLLTLVPAAALSAAAASVNDTFVSGGIFYLITNTTEGSKQVQVYSGSQSSGDVVIPESVTYEDESYSVTSLASNAFGNCRNMTSLSIPSGVTLIPNSEFAGCSGLISVSIPSSVTEIGLGAFASCSSLTTVNFAQDSQLTKIGQQAFESSGLKSVAIPSSVTELGVQAFAYCSSLATVSFAPNCKLTEIGQGAFASTAIASVTIPPSITTIDEGAFPTATPSPEARRFRPLRLRWEHRKAVRFPRSFR